MGEGALWSLLRLTSGAWPKGLLHSHRNWDLGIGVCAAGVGGS